MNTLKILIVYCPGIIFSLIRLPVYLEGNGIYWTDALFVGFLAMAGESIYNRLDKKNKEEE